MGRGVLRAVPLAADAAPLTPPAPSPPAGAALPQPPAKPLPSQDISPHMAGLRNEEDLNAFIQGSKPGTAVVEFGTSWCQKCHEMFPAFYKLCKQVSPSASKAAALTAAWPGPAPAGGALLLPLC